MDEGSKASDICPDKQLLWHFHIETELKNSSVEMTPLLYHPLNKAARGPNGWPAAPTVSRTDVRTSAGTPAGGQPGRENRMGRGGPGRDVPTGTPPRAGGRAGRRAVGR